MSQAEEENVKVAVRMRCFSQPELDAKATRIVRMEEFDKGSRTIVKNPSSSDEKKFELDYSFQSFSPAETGAGRFYTQEDVFETIGRPLMVKALEGRNITLFAYGQTGSGKSYSMLGKEGQPGIIPLICDAIFKDIEEQKKKGPPRPGATIDHKVDIQVVEIYCEMVRDLLVDRKTWPPGGLEIKQLPTGIGVKALRRPCTKYAHIAEAIKTADQNRAVGAHALNSESSRAHTIYTVTYERTTKDGKDAKPYSVWSRLNLVDLAGSERTDKAKTAGQMQKEGIAINQALSHLGDCIKNLSEGKTPVYRNSKLTRLLQGSLTDGKVVMIAAISPASTCYDETISTLEFAKRIKKVKIKSKMNVTADPVARLQKEIDERRTELQKEIDELREQLRAGGGNPAVKEKLRKALDALNEEITQLEGALEQGVHDMEASSGDKMQDYMNAAKSKTSGGVSCKDPKDITLPHLRNLNPDPRLSETLNYEIESGMTTVGRYDPENPPKFELNGKGMKKDHAKITFDGQHVFIMSDTPHARVLVNGRPVGGEGYKELLHNYRVWLGGNYAFRFVFPGHEGDGDPMFAGTEPPTFGFAETEISQIIGFRSPMGLALPEEIMAKLSNALRGCEQANIMTKDLTKNWEFQAKLFLNSITDQPDVCIMVDDGSQMETYWTLDRFQRMMDAYEGEWERWEQCNFLGIKYTPPAVDPYTDVEDDFVGDAEIWLQSLANMVGFKYSAPILSIPARAVGNVDVELVPLGKNGRPGPWVVGDPNDPYVADPSQLLDQTIQFEVRLTEVTFEPNLYNPEEEMPCPYHHTSLRYKINALDESEDWTVTPVCRATTITQTFNFAKRHQMKVNRNVLNHLQNGRVLIQVFAQRASGDDMAESEDTVELTGVETELAKARDELRRMEAELGDAKKLVKQLL